MQYVNIAKRNLFEKEKIKLFVAFDAAMLFININALKKSTKKANIKDVNIVAMCLSNVD